MQNQSPSTTQSPDLSQTENSNDILAEASSASLDELMNRVPGISDTEADVIINYLRAQREKFAIAEATPKPKKTPRKKGPIISADELLKDIDLNF